MIVFKRAIGGGEQEHYSVKFRIKGKQILRSLGTGDKKLAKQRAADLKRELEEGHWEVLEKSKLRSDLASIGEIVALYKGDPKKGRLGIRAVNETIRAATVPRNANMLLNLLHHATGTDREGCGELRTDVLTEDLIQKFKVNYLKPAGEDVEKRESAKRGANAVILQARSLFTPVAMGLYKGLKLPDLGKFRKAPGCKVKKRELVPIDDALIEKINAAAAPLKESDPALYVVHLCFKYLGMRNIEICAARKGWIERNADGSGWMAVVQRPDFDPKGNQRRIPIAAEVMGELDELTPDLEEEDYLVAAPHKTARKFLVDKAHSEFMRPFTLKHPKTSYELRRWAGSVIYSTFGPVEAKNFLGHKSLATTETHYAYLRTKLRPISHALASGVGLAMPKV